MSRRLVRRSIWARFLSGNDITLLQNGETYFPALEAAILSARSHVWLETYIFADDAIGRRIRDALAAAASRGAQVRVMVDGFGSNKLRPGWWQPLLDAGGEVRVFRPEHNVWSFKRTRLRRLHRKLAVVDRQVAFVSGINIQDDWDIPGQSAPRFDFAVKLVGPLVQRRNLRRRRVRNQKGRAQQGLHYCCETTCDTGATSSAPISRLLGMPGTKYSSPMPTFCREGVSGVRCLRRHSAA
jgi:phosphatidylserine/phosphatidylglycerophosphate/cardiolipin synthase-like enzyme